MLTTCNNKRCGYDFATVRATIPFATLPKNTTVAEPTTVHCPVCGQAQPELLAKRGIFREAPEKNEWIRWKLKTVHQEGRNGLVTLYVGDDGQGLGLVFTHGIQVKELRAEEICYPAVPAFKNAQSAQLTVPTLPVKPEFLQYLDESALLKARSGTPEARKIFGRIEDDGGRKYHCQIPLRDVDEQQWESLVFNLHPADDHKDYFEGVFIRSWPNLKVRTLRWRYVLVSVGAADDRGLALLNRPGRTWEAVAIVPTHTGELGRRRESEQVFHKPFIKLHEHTGSDASPLTVKEPWVTKAMKKKEQEGLQREVQWLGRPAWVSFEVRDQKNAVTREAGGVFGLLPAAPEDDRRDTLLGTVEFGLDFGTTNTVLALRVDGDADKTGIMTVPEALAKHTDEWIVGVDTLTLRPEIDVWPGRPWAGRYKDLIPSELISKQQWSLLPSVGHTLNVADVGVDLGIAFGEPSADHEKHVVSEFKWRDALGRGSLSRLRDEAEHLQTRFLDAMMLQALGAIASEQHVPSSVKVYYSYPPAFQGDDLLTLHASARAMRARLRKYIDFNRDEDLQVAPGLDEASAAASGATGDHMFTVHVDIGGGSLELLVEDNMARMKTLGHSGWKVPVFSTSLYFGGRVFLRSLVGENNCISNMGYTRLAAEVRRFRSGREIITGSLIHNDAFKRVAERRAKIYVEYIVEFVARSLAALCLEHGFRHDLPGDSPERGDTERPWNLAQNRLFTCSDAERGQWRLGRRNKEDGGVEISFDLKLLGNGWGCAEVVYGVEGTNVEEQMRGRIERRVKEILRECPDRTRRVSDGKNSLEAAVERIRVWSKPLESDERKGGGLRFLTPRKSHRKTLTAWHVLEAGAQEARQSGSNRHGVLGFDVVVEDEREVEWHRTYGFPPHKYGVDDIPSDKRTSFEKNRVRENQAQKDPSTDLPPRILHDELPPPPPSGDWWFLDAEKNRHGPLDPTTLAQTLVRTYGYTRAGEIKVWRKGSRTSWLPVRDLPEVAVELEKHAPKGDWYFLDGSTRRGPFALAGLVEQLTRGRPRDAALQTRVWRKGMKDWTRAESVPEVLEKMPGGDDEPPPPPPDDDEFPPA